MMHVILREGLEDRAYVDSIDPRLRSSSPSASATRAHARARRRHDRPDVRRHRSCSQFAYGRAGRDGRAPRPSGSTTAYSAARTADSRVRAVCDAARSHRSWQHRGGGLLLSTAGGFPWNSSASSMPELAAGAPARAPARRTVNMSQLGDALTRTRRSLEEGPPREGALRLQLQRRRRRPESERVQRGLRRDDLFTVVHDQFFTDTTDYADIVLPATTFLEHKELMGAYGHYFAQLSQQAIAPLGEARTNVQPVRRARTPHGL